MFLSNSIHQIKLQTKINNLNYAKPWILLINVVLRVSSSDMCDMWTKNKYFIQYNRPSPHFLIAWRNANGFGSNFNCCHEGQIVMLKKYFGNIGAETFDSFCRKYFTHLTITWECFLENWRSNKNLKLNLQTLYKLIITGRSHITSAAITRQGNSECWQTLT